jgi:CRP/FNR family cyclic AMP-dependent transcriptional regulator
MALLRRQSDKAQALGAVDLFSGLTKKELTALARLADEVDVAEGTTLATQGEHGRQVEVILQGTAVVRRNGRKVAELGRGDVVGEISLVTHRPRNADVVTTSPSTLLVLDGRAFDTVMAEMPSVSQKVLRIVADRLAEADPKLP